MMRWLVLLFTLPALGAVTNVRVAGTTPVEAVIAYTAPDSSPCTVEASENSSFTPLVPAVNSSLFSSSNSDGGGGRARTFVIGARRSAVANDGKAYSLALQAGTAHYFRITCGGDVAAGKFTTAPIPFGRTYQEALQPHPNRPGEYIWPTPDWRNRNQTIVDPQTGALIRRISMPRDFTDLSLLNQTFTSASGANWANPQSALVDDSSDATYSNSGRDWLVLLKHNLSPYAAFSVDWISVEVKGSGAAASAGDRSLEVCLTLDGGATCDGEIREVVLDQTITSKTLGTQSTIDTWREPNRVNIRTGEIRNNPDFGIRLRKKTTSSDQIAIRFARLHAGISVQYNLGSGGDYVACSDNTDAEGFFHCALTGDGGSPNGVYAVHGETGAARYLGALRFNPGTGQITCFVEHVSWDNIAPRTVYCNLFKGVIQDNTEVTQPGAWANISWTAISAAPFADRVQEFYDAHSSEYEVAFDKNKFACNPVMTVHRYMMIRCRRGVQGTYAWIAAYSLDMEEVIALMPLFNTAIARWCSDHSFDPPGHEAPVYFGTTQNLFGGAAGRGPYQVKLAEPVTSVAQTHFVVESASLWNAGWGHSPPNGEPVSPTADHFLQETKAGDVFDIGSEKIRITVKNSPTSWTVQRGVLGTPASTYPAGQVLSARCANASGANKYDTAVHPVWKFLEDPFGQDTTAIHLWANRYIGHITARHNRIVNVFNYLAEAEEGVNILSEVYDPSYDLEFTGFRFAGQEPGFQGNSWQSHPTHHQVKAPAQERMWGADIRPFIGGNVFTAQTFTCSPDGDIYPAPGGCVAKRVAGTSDVYQYTTIGGNALDYKYFAPLALCGSYILTDISSPAAGNQVNDAAPYVWCRAQRAGECRSGSNAGDIYFNCPTINTFYCSSSRGNQDACIVDTPMHSTGAYQIGWVRNREGAPPTVTDPKVQGVGWHRVLTTFDSAVHSMSVYATGKALANGNWLLHPGSRPDRKDVYLVKVPPFSGKDSVRRDRFAQIPLTLNPPPGVDNVIVEFGYDSSFRCTGRDEACVKDANVSEPYVFAGDFISGIPCAGGCTVEIPSHPTKIVHYRWTYRNAANEVVAVSTTHAVAVP